MQAQFKIRTQLRQGVIDMLIHNSPTMKEVNREFEQHQTLYEIRKTI